MSCNGCRVLRKGCSQTCILRPCLQWIESPEAQAHATLFVAKFFGRSDLMSFISAVPDHQKPAVFQSLLYEACGRSVNPVNGAVGLLWTGNWHVCEAAVDTVLSGGSLRPMDGNIAGNLSPDRDESSETFCNEWKARDEHSPFVAQRFSTKIFAKKSVGKKRSPSSFNSDEQVSAITSFVNSGDDDKKRNKLLNLFV